MIGECFLVQVENELLLIRPLSSVVSVMSFQLVLSYGQSSLAGDALTHATQGARDSGTSFDRISEKLL